MIRVDPTDGLMDEERKGMSERPRGKVALGWRGSGGGLFWVRLFVWRLAKRLRPNNQQGRSFAIIPRTRIYLGWPTEKLQASKLLQSRRRHPVACFTVRLGRGGRADALIFVVVVFLVVVCVLACV